MRAGRTLVKISILSGLGCATAPETVGTFGIPSPDSRAGDVAEAEKQSGIEIRYHGSLDLPGGRAELYEVGASKAVFIYLPVGDSPLLSFATARRFVRETGERMNGIERRVATELWRMGLDDRRRHALFELGATVHQERDDAGLYEWVSLPWTDPAQDAAALFEILGRATSPDPEALLGRVLADTSGRRDEVERARARASELLEGIADDDPSLAVSALVAGRASLSAMSRTADVDAAMLMGPVGRRTALRAAAKWLRASREGPSPASVQLEPEVLIDSSEIRGRRFLASFPIPDHAGRSIHGEMATRWLAMVLRAREPKLPAVLDIRLERATSLPRLDFVFELAESTTATLALGALSTKLEAATRSKIERGVRRELAEQAERERRERIEGPYPLLFALLQAALRGEIDNLVRPVVAPRPGVLSRWLEAVLRRERASCVFIPTREPSPGSRR